MKQGYSVKEYSGTTEALCAFLQDVVAPQANQLDQQQSIPKSLRQQAAALHLWGICVPTEYGGIALDAEDFSQVCMATGKASGSLLSLLTIHSMVCAAISRWGTKRQKQTLLPELAQGDKLAAFAQSEPQVGCDVVNLQTGISKSEEGYSINGCKKWISGAQVADLFLVAGQLQGKPVALLVDRHQAGVEITSINDMLGFRAAMLGEVTFNNCQIPHCNLLGSEMFGLAQLVGSVLDVGRHAIACGATGLAQACLQLSTEYAASRKVAGKPLNELQLIQQMLSDSAVQTRAAMLMCMDAAKARDKGLPDMIVKSSAAKYFASATAKLTADNCVQILGAMGCSAESDAQRLLRDAKIFDIIEGSTQIQQTLISGEGENWVFNDLASK